MPISGHGSLRPGGAELPLKSNKDSVPEPITFVQLLTNAGKRLYKNIVYIYTTYPKPLEGIVKVVDAHEQNAARRTRKH
jgi:hypothetical protein